MSYELFLIRIAENLEKIADSLEKLVKINEAEATTALTLHFQKVDSPSDDDDEEEDEDEEDGWAETDEDGRVVDESDPSDGPFFVQEPLDIDGFADYPDVDRN